MAPEVTRLSGFCLSWIVGSLLAAVGALQLVPGVGSELTLRRDCDFVSGVAVCYRSWLAAVFETLPFWWGGAAVCYRSWLDADLVTLLGWSDGAAVCYRRGSLLTWRHCPFGGGRGSLLPE